MSRREIEILEEFRAALADWGRHLDWLERFHGGEEARRAVLADHRRMCRLFAQLPSRTVRRLELAQCRELLDQGPFGDPAGRMEGIVDRALARA